MVSSDLIKRCLVGSTTSLADAGVANIAMNVPIDIQNGLGIQIWGWELEIAGAGALLGAADTWGFSAELARTLGTQERHLNDPDVISKMSKIVDQGAAGLDKMDLVFEKDMYPAIPFVGPQLHVTITNNTTGVIDVYVKVWYSTIRVNYRESMAMLQNQIF